MVASRWVWGLLGSVAILSGTSAAKTQELPPTPRLLAQTEQNTDADILFAEGLQLFQERTAESYQQAISKFKEALSLYEQQNNQAQTATINLAIGKISDNLGFKQDALTYYGSALNIYEAIKNRGGEAITLSNIGAVYSDLGEKEQALDYYEQALPLSRAVGDRNNEAGLLNNIGGVYSDLGEKQQALDYYEQALPLLQAVGDRSGEGYTLNNIGGVYSDLGEKQQALNYYQQALLLSRAVGDRRGEAITLNNIGAVYDALGEKQQALDHYQQALPLSRAVGDRSVEATTLNNIGLVYSDLGEKEKALDYYKQALPLSRAVGDHTQEATTLNNIGLVYSDLGEKEKALDYYKQALPLSRTAGNRSGEAATLNNIGGVYDALGEKQEALDFYQQALPLSRTVGDRSGEATTLNNIGAVYSSLGEKQQALDFYKQALLLLRAVGDRRLEATTLNNIGAVYSSLGEKQQALDHYQQALPLSRAVGDRRVEATTLNNIGVIYNALGEREKALEYFEESLPLLRAVGDRSVEATSLNNIGAIYSDLGEKQQAFNYYEQALSLNRAVGDRRGEAYLLNNIGMVYGSLGEKEKALAYLGEALPLRRAVGDRSGEETTLYNVAYLEKDRGNFEKALPPIQQSIAILEDLRTKVASPELRQTYFSTVQNRYKFYIDLLMELHQQNPSEGYDKQAFEVSEKSRARTLLELLTEANIDLKLDPTLQQREQELTQKLNQTEQQRLTLFQDPNSTAAAKEAINQTLDQLLTDFQTLEDDIRRSSPNYAELKYPETTTVTDLQTQSLDDDTVLLQYALGAEKSYLWVVTKDEFHSYELPKEAELNEMIRDVRQAITNTKETEHPLPVRRAGIRQERLATTQALSEQIIAPAAKHLTKKRILFVPDGKLHELPFGALTDGNSTEMTLSHQYEIVNLPSSSTIASIREQGANEIAADPSLAIFADPVFSTDDCRFSNAPNCDQERLLAAKIERTNVESDYVEWDDLPGTYTEASNILTLFSDPSKTNAAFGFNANREGIIDDQLQNYDLIHFATHGFFHRTQPDQSGLVFSLLDQDGKPQNGFLRLDSIFDMELDADLVILSACETGLGEEVQGEGMIGLSRGFMYAGTPRLLMSLWKVDDAATAEFMTRFYRNLLEEKLTAVAALKETQREMREETTWSHPSYWSAFILQGEWN